MGRMERIKHHPACKPLLTEAIRERLHNWLEQQPDARKIGLRLKKSRSAFQEIPEVLETIGGNPSP